MLSTTTDIRAPSRIFSMGLLVSINRYLWEAYNHTNVSANPTLARFDAQNAVGSQNVSALTITAVGTDEDDKYRKERLRHTSA
jgi:hypothetical protein